MTQFPVARASCPWTVTAKMAVPHQIESPLNRQESAFKSQATSPFNINPHTLKPALVNVAREATLRMPQRAAGTLPAR